MKLEFPLESGDCAFFCLFQKLSPPSILVSLALQSKYGAGTLNTVPFSRNENQQTQHVQPQPQPTTTLKSTIGQH